MSPFDYILELIKQNRDAIKLIQRKLNDDQTLEEAGTDQPVMELGPNHPLQGGPNGPLMQYVTIVRSVYDTTRSFAAQRAKPTTDTNTFWAADPSLISLLTAKVPANLDMPAIGDTLLLTFTGVNSSGAIYGLFGGGGGSASQYIVKSVSDDHLVCRTFVESTEGDTDVLVAKPFKLRKNPFHGLTINSLVYSYHSGVSRAVSLQGDGTMIQTQAIVPAYVVNNDLIYAMACGDMGLTAATTPITLLDLNVDGRVWAKATV